MNVSELDAKVWKGYRELRKIKKWVFVSIIMHLIQVIKPGRILKN